MSMFSFLNSSKADRGHARENPYGGAVIKDGAYKGYLENDFLGKAALAGQTAKAATAAAEYDKAWGLLHEQKSLYMQHANRGRWKKEHVLQLDGSVSESLANILRLEGKHDQALVHLLYWIVTSLKSAKREGQKLKAYLGRCKFKKVPLEEVEQFAKISRGNPDLSTIQSKVKEWRDTETA